jgi:hypothetical protein
MSRVKCLFCDAENDAVQTAGYCEGCGKKLPPAAQAHRRRLSGLYEAGTSASDLEQRPVTPASGWLFTAAILHLIGCGVLVVVGPLVVSRERLPAEFLPNLILVGAAVLLVLAGLGWAARYQPTLAAVVGLVAYAGLAFAGMAAAPGLAVLGLPVNVVILALLIHAIRTSRVKGGVTPPLQ